MRFAVVTAYQPVDQLIPLAQAADELGYHSVSIADHVVDLEALKTPYPYETSGERRWSNESPWPDPFVMIGALGALTQRLSFFTSIYVAAMRSPFVVAKAVGTAACLAPGRVRLGVGVGWCREEFELLEQDFATRGKRTDEAIDLMRELWKPGYTESEGPFYPTPKLTMEPTPGQVPILVGGLSEVAFKRAARNDGWIGDMAKTADALATADRLLQIRRELPDEAFGERSRDGEFEIITALMDAFLPEHFEAVGQGGITECMVMPWAYYHAIDCSLEQKLDGLERFAKDVIEKM